MCNAVKYASLCSNNPCNILPSEKVENVAANADFLKS